ncbi:MAG: hypothetical protein JW864_07160 [Spirochaetes bacterium]|nr:hypothetical protein [Spirochaetota bacterium]
MKRFFIFSVILLFIQAAAGGNADSAEMIVKGFVDSYHAVGIESPNDFLSSRTRARIESQFSGQNAFTFISLNAVKNEVVESESGFNLMEAYVDYASDLFDMRIGRQIVIWGKADGFLVTDIISPKDYSEYFARDFDDMRLPVDALKMRLLGDYFTLELIGIPVFTPSKIPFTQEGVSDENSNNPWAQVLPAGVIVADEELPELKLSNAEAAAKISYSGSIMDFSLSAFYTWDDNPVMYLENGVLNREYHRFMFCGFDFSIPAGVFVFRGEGAYYCGKNFTCENIILKPIEKDTLDSLAGIDWSPEGNWTISAQVYNRYILEYDKIISEDESKTYSSLSISKDMLRETLTLSAMIFYGYRYNDAYGRVYTEYAVTDAFHLTLGLDIFYGDEGDFGQYSDNSEVFLKAKYSF